jgi:hypothetical protein
MVWVGFGNVSPWTVSVSALMLREPTSSAQGTEHPEKLLRRQRLEWLLA